MRRRWRIGFGAAALAAVAVVLVTAGVTGASQPASQNVSVPAVGKTTTISWTGTIPANANPESDCTALPVDNSDHHGVTIKTPKAGYTGLKTTFTFQISWTPASGNENTNDEILTVTSTETDGGDTGQTRVIGTSDGSSTKETVGAQNLPPGNYDVLACGFANVLPQPYKGTLTIHSAKLVAGGSLASAKTNLAFSAAVPADPQRDEAEPLIVSDKAGLIYTCGPTGFSNAADYAQVSTDGGDQFHLLGTPPRGQQSDGGGGDCALATGLAKNSAGHYQYAYAGLGALSGFSTSTSPDNGHTITAAGANSTGGVTSNGALADRQWMTFINGKTVLLSYNQQQPRNTVVIRSTDGGLTYSPVSAIAAPNPDFPGPMHYIPSIHTVVMPWTLGEQVNLAISRDGGTTWTDCKVAHSPGGTAGFATADVDSAGNVYVAWADATDYHTWLAALKVGKVAGCKQSIAAVSGTANGEPTVDPGFTKPLQMDRDAVRTTVFPWVAAGGTPGRAAVAFYGTPVDGDPNTGQFKAAWNVYVSQTLNAFSSKPTVGQAKATTHPFHYDSICLNGLGCDISGGDRSLADFFAITYDVKDKRLSVVFNRTNKKPGDAAGYVATPLVTTQIAGPSNGGGTVSVKNRAVLRRSTTDPKGDALTPYSQLLSTPATKNVRAGDFTGAAIGPDRKTGGFTVTLHLANLSSAALSNAAGSGSLVWIWRFTNGWQDAAAVAKWSSANGFSFGYDGYKTDPGTCGGEGGGKCEIYPGGTAIKGAVNRKTGTITLVVPRSVLHPLSGHDAAGRPKQGKAVVGSRFYDGTAFSFANPSPDPSTQGWMTQLDNTPAFDFLLPSAKSTRTSSSGNKGTKGSTGTKGSKGSKGSKGNKGNKGGSTASSVRAKSVAPYRLVIDRLRISPGVISSHQKPVRLSIHISDTHGDTVRGALVYVRGIPARRVAQMPERTTNVDGWATFTLKPGNALPLQRGGWLALFVRARVPGEPILAGASIRRLVSVRVFPQRPNAKAKLSPERRIVEGPNSDRLEIAKVSFHPTARHGRLVHVRVRVVHEDGSPAVGARVEAIGVPFARVSGAPEATTGRNGWARFTLRQLRLSRGRLLTLFVRGRFQGQPLLAGASTRRLVAARIR